MKKTIHLLIVIFAFSGLLRAQDGGSFALKTDHAALSVKDVDRSAAFYANVLKLQEITNRTKMPGIRWFALSEGKELHLISILSGNIATNKAVHMGLSTRNFDEVVKTLDESKIFYSDWPGASRSINRRADGIKQIYLQDPDGNWIEVNNAGTAPASARTAAPTDKTDVMAVIRTYVDAFNKGDTAAATAVCAERTSIIDEFPPYAWQGAGTCAKWMADYDADAKKNGITDGVVTLGKPKFVDVSGDRAYAVIPSNYTFKLKGKRVAEIGSMFTFALGYDTAAAGWRITGWSWSKN